MKNKKTIAGLLLVLLLIITGCANESGTEGEEKGESTSEDKSLTMLYSFASETIDPHQDFMGVRAGIAETLVKIDENLEIQPWLAESWEQKDETTWVFTLRDDVTFHDGSTMDGEAVKASFERAIEVNEALASALKIDEIKVDGQQVTFKTTEEYPAFLSELVHTNASIIKADAENIGEQPIATGAFQVENFSSEEKIQLKKYPEYWDGEANLDDVTITFNSDGNVRALALQSGEADIAYHLPPESLEPIESNNELRVESVASLRVHFFLYNSAKPELQDVKVRQALDLLVNREVGVEEIMTGHATAASGPFNPDRKSTRLNSSHRT